MEIQLNDSRYYIVIKDRNEPRYKATLFNQDKPLCGVIRQSGELVDVVIDYFNDKIKRGDLK